MLFKDVFLASKSTTGVLNVLISFKFRFIFLNPLKFLAFKLFANKFKTAFSPMISPPIFKGESLTTVKFASFK